MQAPKQKPKELIPVGTHKAKCYMVCDLGTHEITYPGSAPKPVRQLMITWELPDCRAVFEVDGEKIDKPRVISQTYTFSTFKKSNLSVHVTSWMGKCDDNFDFESLLMEPCLLNIVHEESKSSGTKYDKVASVSQLMDGMTVPDLFNDVIYYSITEHGKDLPQALVSNERMKWLVDKIAESNEWKHMNHAAEAMGLDQEQMEAHEEAAPIGEDTTDYSDGNDQPFGPGGDDIPF